LANQPLADRKNFSLKEIRPTPGANPATSGPNPTISIYNASVVKIYNAANSLARF
jgi:hypothetical protein